MAYEISAIVEEHNEILLYGKGKVGTMFMQWLVLQHLDNHVCGFVVSQADGEDVFMEKPVVEISQVKQTYPQTMIIICVTDRYRQEIVDIISGHGLTNYMILSDEMINKCSIYVRHFVPRESLKFEVHITEHCNLNCRGCYHCSPLANEEFLSVEEFERDCKRLSELYQGNLGFLELLGGEPLLHPDIIDFFRVSRTTFATGKIVLVTNGILLPQMKEDFWEAAKKYNIEFFPTHYPINVDYKAIQRKAESYGIPYHPFSMTTDDKGNKILEHYHFDIEGRQSSAENFYRCYRGNSCIFLNHGKMYSCVVGANLYHFKEYFGLDQIEIPENNGIDIYSAKSAEEISEFLTRPMPVCKYCSLREEKTFVPFQLSKKQIEEWL